MAEAKANPLMPDPKVVEDQVNAVCADTEKLIASTNYVEALKTSLRNPPWTKDEAVKRKSSENFTRALSAIKDQQVQKFLDEASAEELNTLAKYLYRAMAICSEKKEKEGTGKDAVFGILLKWLGLVIDKGGNGVILQAMTDKRL